MTEWKPTEEQIEAACRAVLAAYGDPAAEWWDYRREVTAALVAAHEAGGGNAPTADPPNKIIASMKDAVSYAKGCGASASIRSMGRGSAHASTAEPAGDVKSSVAFLNEAARYFES